MPHFPFQRLQADLADLIAKAPPGFRLPSEPVLSKQLGVSRATLREAMRTFETQGLIRRRQGAGTFVVGKIPVIDSGLEVLESLQTMAARINLDVTPGEITITEFVAADIINLTDPNAGAVTDDFPLAFTAAGDESGYTATAEGTITATRMFDVQLIAPTNQYVKQFPLGREPCIKNTEFLRIRVKAGTAVNAYCYIIFEV